MSIDVAAVRADTPSCETILHFNNAGAALSPTPVNEAVVDHLRLEAEIGGYEAQDAAAERRQRCYAATARMLNCDANEVALTTGASEGWWRAFQALELEPGDRILADRAQYNSNAFALIQARRRGVSVDIVGDDADGQIDLRQLEAELDERVKLVSLTHIPTSGGLVNPAEAVGELTRASNAMYFLDACQSAGQRELDVQRIHCDVLAFTGRKFLRGPRGTGALYVRRSAMDRLGDPTFIDSHSADWVSEDTYALRDDATRFELFESSIAAQIGYGVAVEYALQVGIGAIQERVVSLAESLRDALGALAGVTVHDLGTTRSGIVVFGTAHRPAAEVCAALRARKANTSVAAAVTAQLDLGSRGIETALRASVHYYNTEDEIGRFVELLAEADRAL